MSSLIFPAFLMAYEFILYMSNDMYMPFFPFIAQEFQVHEDLVSLTLSSWLLGGVLAQIVLGPLSDRFGRKIILLLGGGLFMVSCILCILSPSIQAMMGARFLQGIGVCSMMIAGYACIHETYEDKKAIKILTLMSSISMIAPMIGPVMGGYLALFYNWRIVFWVLLVSISLPLMALYFYMPEGQRISSSSFTLRSTSEKYIKLLRNKVFMSSSLCFSMGYGCVMLWISVSPFLLMQGYHMDSYSFGLAQLPVFGAFMIGTRITSHFISTLLTENLIKYSFCFVSLGLAFLGSTCFWNFCPLLIASVSLSMVGFGMLLAPLNRLAFNSSQGEKGITASLFYTCMMGVGAVAIKIFGYLDYTVFNFVITFSLLAVSQMILFSMIQSLKSPTLKMKNR